MTMYLDYINHVVMFTLRLYRTGLIVPVIMGLVLWGLHFPYWIVTAALLIMFVSLLYFPLSLWEVSYNTEKKIFSKKQVSRKIHYK